MLIPDFIIVGVDKINETVGFGLNSSLISLLCEFRGNDYEEQ
jgi:hypothetical protein